MVFCSVLTIAPFSLLTKCPFVHIRGLRAGLHPRVGCKAEGLGASIVSPWPSDTPDAVSSSQPHSTSWRAICLGVGSQALTPSPGRF